MKKKIMALILAAGIMLQAAMPMAVAAKAPTSMKITGKSTVTAGKTIELDSVLLPKGSDVDDDRILWSSSKCSVVKVLENRDDDTKIKGIKAGTATITVRIKGTKLKATKTITVKAASKSSKKTSLTTTSDAKKIACYKTEAQKIKKEIQDLKLADSRSGRAKQYRALEKKLDRLEDKLDAIEDKWEHWWKARKASRKQYLCIERKTEAVEDYLDSLEDYLEKKFHYEFD